jgi:hypothetical protein
MHYLTKKMERQIEGRIGKGTVIVLGDWSTNSHFGHRAPTPNKRLTNLLRKKISVIDVDEYNTSKLCSVCHQELEKPLLTKKPRQEKKKELKSRGDKKKPRSIRPTRPTTNNKNELKSEGEIMEARPWSVRRCINNDCNRTFWNRDTNAALNILHLFLCLAQNKERPGPFKRSNNGPAPETIVQTEGQK